MAGQTIKSLVEKLWRFDFAPVSPDADRAVAVFREELDFKVHEYPSGLETNGWVIPDSWSYAKAEIREAGTDGKPGKLVYDGRANPLGVVGYSPSFQGRVALKELKNHLFYSADWKDDLVFHCTHFFRRLERSWGFCVPKNLHDALPEGEYDVEIVADIRPGTMKVLEFTLPGSTTDTIVFHAHNCHPGQANDDLSGCAVGIEAFKRLAQVADRRLTYTLIISPELFGSFYWLDSLEPEQVARLKHAVMLKSVGNDAPLKLQRSYPGDTYLDLAARNALRFAEGQNGELVEGAFRRLYGNDETIFEAPGYKIPSISLTRFPFAEYHTSRDTPDVVLETRLEQTVRAIEDIAYALERNSLMQGRFKGLLALSHPKYDLYQMSYNPANKTGPKLGQQTDWYYLMVDMFRDFESNISILEVAERHQLAFRDVHAYFTRMRDKGAIELTPAPDHPAKLQAQR